MQLSLPLPSPVYPEPAVAGAENLAAGFPGRTPADPAADSFEKCFPEDNPEAKPAADEERPGVEKTESILAASFWMPGVTLPPTAMPVAAAGQPVTGRNGFAWGTQNLPARAESVGAANASMLGESPARPSPAALNPFTLSGQTGLFPNRPSEFSVAPSPWVCTPAAPEAANSNPGEQTGGADSILAGTSAAQTQPTEVAAQLTLSPLTLVAAMPAGNGLTLTGAGQHHGLEARPPVEKISPPVDDGAEQTIAEIAAVDQPVTAVATLSPAVQSLAGRNPSLRENLAATSVFSPGNFPSKKASDKKDFLKTDHAAVTASGPEVGIGVAKVTAAMSAVLSNRPKSAQAAEPVPVVPVAVGQLPALTLAKDILLPTASVREAVAAVFSAVDALQRRENTGPKLVDLQFSVGDAQLALRVELKEGTVHATFRTESTELRTALAQEWQSVVQPAGAREIRLAEPVFSSAAGGAESAFSSLGQGTPHQRGQAMPEPAHRNFTPISSDAGMPDPAPAAVLASHSPSLLHAFA